MSDRDEGVILVVEDDPAVRNLVTCALDVHGYRSREASTATAALADLTCARDVNLVILDLGLSDRDGTEVIGAVRGWSRVPIIVLSARQEDADKVTALDAGADDYLTKPFSVAELLARVRVALRRVAFDETEEEAGETYRNGDLAIDFDAKVVVRGDDEIHLTPIEYKLLVLLARNTGKVLTHNYILKEVWGQALTSDLPSLRVFMATLRKKIEPDPASPVYLQTHVGIGYYEGGEYGNYWVMIFTYAPNTSNDQFAQELLTLVNNERTKNGLSALTLGDANLKAAAEKRAQEVAKTASHTRPDGTNCFTVLGEYGVKQTGEGEGENIGWGEASAQEVFDSWMASDSHRANILNPSATEMGVGYYFDATSAWGHQWVQLFV